MKQAKCSEMGGPATCDHMITGSTVEEMVNNGMKHMKEAHPVEMEEMMKLPKEEGDKWMAEFSAKFPTLADAPADDMPMAA